MDGKAQWRNGSASDSRSDGWAFESLWPHFFCYSSCSTVSARGRFCFADVQKVEGSPIRDSIVVSISACHADDPGSIPGRGVFLLGLKSCVGGYP